MVDKRKIVSNKISDFFLMFDTYTKNIMIRSEFIYNLDKYYKGRGMNRGGGYKKWGINFPHNIW